MKRHYMAVALGMAISAFSLQSCLDFDISGDEFNSTTENVAKVTNRGQVDSIKYKQEVSAKTVDSVANVLQEQLRNGIGAQSWMRGGKNGGNPVEHAYQYQFCLGVDNYAQYGVIPHQMFGYSKINITSTYNIDPKAYGGAMSSFQGMAQSCVPLLNHPAVDSIPEIKAMYLLLYDYAAIEVADIYGPFPYNDLKTNKQTNPYIYDDVQSIYNQVKANIDTIVNCFDYFTQKSPEYQQAVLSIFHDNIKLSLESYQNLDIWKRFANSLKLRMAMHIVKVAPTMAKEWAEEAVASGVIESEKQEVSLRPVMLGFGSPLMGIYDWNDTRMTASMESLLKSLNHPFLENLFIPIKNDIINSKTGKVTKAGSMICGMRSGSHPGDGQGYDGNQYVAFSTLNKELFSTAPLYLMKLAEVCFLRAEGAIRGWDMKGTAQDFYEQGIREANFEDREMKSTYYEKDGQYLNYYDALVNDYMAQEQAKPFTYVDPTGDTDPIESVTKIGVKWNESDSPETKLEKIITQKYLAGFPYSYEAFVDLRRTGYPKLFEVLNADECDGSIQQGEMIRRLPFPGRQDASTLQDITATGMKALGGPDVCGTRLWWDVQKSNF